MAGYCLKNRYTGFTLIEILITLAIVGIITAIALPAYNDSRLRAGRADGKEALMQVASDQERFYSNNFRYTTYAAPLAATPSTNYTSRDGKYIVSVAACGSSIDSCFIATAVPQGKQAEDGCGNLTIDSIGARDTSSGDAADCWQR